MKEKEKKAQKTEGQKENSLKVVKQKMDVQNVIKKWLIKTPLTILLIAIIIAIYIGINFAVEKADFSDIDLTADKKYSLSEASKNIIKTIDKDVKIMLIKMNTVQSVMNLTHKYNKINDKIQVEEINDLTKIPDIVNKYNLTENSFLILIQCGEKEKVLTTNDLYTWDYTTGAQIDLTEEVMTNTLLDITLDKKPKIYFLTGHNKYANEYTYYFRQSLTDETNEVEILDLLTKTEIPEDCETLVITTLREDLIDLEREAIINYIHKGGKIALFADPNVTKIEMPNFQKVLDEYGISLAEGILLEQDTNQMVSNSPSAIKAIVNTGSSITGKLNMNMSACFMNAGKIETKNSEELEKLGVEIENLVTASNSAFFRKNMEIEQTTKVDEDEDASMAVIGALATKKIDDNTTSKLIVYSNNMFITNIQIQINAQSYIYASDFYNNKDIALNSISYLTEREDTITIRKDSETSTYTATVQQTSIILATIFTIPAVIVIIGLVVWQVRRRKV